MELARKHARKVNRKHARKVTSCLFAAILLAFVVFYHQTASASALCLLQADAVSEYNAKPVAKFIVDKDSYDVGEEVIYTNLSYDPDGDAVYLSWTGRNRAFFIAGQHEVTLIAIDEHGNESEPYTKTITIKDAKKTISPFEFMIKHSQPGEYIEAIDQQFNDALLQLPEAKKKTRDTKKRKLLVSDSPENITESGILYEDYIEGKARLYANHVNAANEPMQLAILVTNVTNDAVTLHTSRRGQSAPSKLAMLAGSEAVLDFLSEPAAEQTRTNKDLATGTSGSTWIEIAPSQTVIYDQLPVMLPQHGINVIYDVESSGELLIHFIAVPSERAEGTDQFPAALTKLPFAGHVRGSFDRSAIKWDVYPRKRGHKQVQMLMIGDGDNDPFLRGFDRLRGKPANLTGNYGVTYELTIHKPGAMAVLLAARGGAFKGAFIVDGQFVRVPASGVLPAFAGFVTVAKSDGSEKSLTLQFIPPAGSSLPVMLILYPLDQHS